MHAPRNSVSERFAQYSVGPMETSGNGQFATGDSGRLSPWLIATKPCRLIALLMSSMDPVTTVRIEEVKSSGVDAEPYPLSRTESRARGDTRGEVGACVRQELVIVRLACGPRSTCAEAGRVEGADDMRIGAEVFDNEDVDFDRGKAIRR
jgi:hypothetical protein